MSIFEFVLVVVSLVLAIGFTSLLREVSSIISNRHLRKIEWIPLVWIATFFLYVPGYWWSLWDFRDIEWTFPRYFMLVLMPTCLYTAMSLLVESSKSADGVSRMEGFERVRIPFFIALAAGQTVGAWDGWLLRVEPFINSLRIGQISLILLFIVGASSSRDAVQKTIAVAVFSLMVFAMFGLRYLPGAFGPE